jgi:type III pantothenate kinase
MANIYIDIGNTHIKAARRKGNGWDLLFKEKVSEVDKVIKRLGDLDKDSRFHICSVVMDATRALEKNLNPKRTHVFRISDVPAEMLDYNTPLTLGMDRFLACYGACSQSDGAVVVVDAGSACTLDLMDEEFVYRGGVIMPGLKTLDTGMAVNLPALPEAKRNFPSEFPGKTTADCVEWGVNGSFIIAIEGFLVLFEEQSGEFELFLTGGDTGFVSEYLTRTESVKVAEMLIFDGMERFYEDVIAG